MSECYDVNGNPLTMDQWAQARREGAWDAVRRSTDVGDSNVSTVWLGFDHRFGDKGPPIVWETMVFGGGLAHTCKRYATQAEAHAGHDEMVERVRVEADCFASLAAEPEVAAAIALVSRRLAEHLAAFDQDDYEDSPYHRLAKAARTSA